LFLGSFFPIQTCVSDSCTLFRAGALVSKQIMDQKYLLG